MRHRSAKHLWFMKEKTGLKYKVLAPFVPRYRELLCRNKLGRPLRLMFEDMVQSADRSLLVVLNPKCATSTTVALVLEYSKRFNYYKNNSDREILLRGGILA